MRANETSELDNYLEKLKSREELKKHLNTNLKENPLPDFSEYFISIIKEKNLTRAEVIRNANIDKGYGYQIFDGSKNPSRDYILRLCISAKFDLKSTERALVLGNAKKLYSKNSRDSIIIFSILKGYDLNTTNSILEEENEDILENNF